MFANINEQVHLPRDWSIVTLAETATDFFGGGTPSTSIPEYWNGDVEWTTSAHISGLYICSGQRRISLLGLENSSSGVVPAGNLIIGTRVGVGKAAVNLIDVAISQDLTAAIVKRERYSPEFLAYSLMTESSQQVFELQKRGATIKGIPREDLFRIPVSAPPLPEQRKIAAVLFKVQRAIELQEKFATTLGQLKAATMAKLFREGLRREPLKQTEIGEIPESWSVQRIGSLAKVGNGSTPSRSNESYWQNGYIPWITSTKIHDTIIRQADEFVTEEARRQCHLPLVPRRSIVIAITGQGKTLGNAAILDIDTCINQHLAYVRFEHPSVHPEFILFYLHSKYQYFRQVASAGGSTKGALTCRFLADMPVPLPSLDEQREIAALLRLLTKRRSIADRMKGTLSTLFRAMLQNLMTGVVRVNHLEIPEVIHAYPRE